MAKFSKIFIVFSAFLSLGLGGCASRTKFYGDAHLGRQECMSKCQGWNMQLVGMVAMGEYSDACLCEVWGGNTSGKAHSEFKALAAAAGGGAASGVATQMHEELEKDKR